MALRGFRAFSPQEVRFVKENLIRGVTVSDLARHFGVSVETVSKIKRGVTYAEVKVEGEEALRPQNPLGERTSPVGVRQTPRGPTEEELEEKEKESQKMLLELLGMNPDGTPKLE